MTSAQASSPPAWTVCVYCGSRSGHHAAHHREATAVGRAIGERRWRLVYGGGKVGLMGATADAALAAGAAVVGVIPQSLVEREVAHAGLSELHVVPDMHQRKFKMASLADAFVALPGGIGTFEELFEVWTWRHLGYHAKPIGLLNVAGYYDPLLNFLENACREGFVSVEQQAMLMVDSDVNRLLDTLAAAKQADRSQPATDLSII